MTASAAIQPVYSASGGAIIPQGGTPGTPIAPPAATLPAATQPTTPNPTPTIGSLYGGISSTDQNVIDAGNAYKSVATTPVDEASIRSSVMNNLQSEIDATNQVFAQKLAEARTAGANLVGSTTAGNARGGLIGSDFGNANAFNANTKAQAGISAVGDEQKAAIQAILDKGNTEATNEINQKQTAQKNGTDSYIGFLNAAQGRQGTRTTTAAQAALSGGIDLTSAPDATIKAIADSYQIDPAALVSSFVQAKNAANKTTADLTKPESVPAANGTMAFNPATGKYEQTSTGTPSDSAIKEYQFAVANDGFTGSLADWNAQKSNQKVSLSVTHDPITGALQTVQRAGPAVSGTGMTKLSTTLPAPKAASTGSAVLPAANANPTTKPPTAPVANPLDTLAGSDLAYAQTGQPSLSKFKYPGQIDGATARIQKVIPGWTPATAASSYAFFKSPATQQFIANSNTVLNTLQQIKELSSKVPRGSIQALNNGQFAVAQGVSDPNAAKLAQLATIAGDEAGKLLGSSGGSDFATSLGLGLINKNYSDTTFAATIDQLAGRVNNKVGEYYKQAGTSAGNQGTATQGGGTPKGSLSDSDFVSQAVTSSGANYNDVVSKAPSGNIPVVLNASGQIGYIPPNEFDPSVYTKM